MSKWLEQKDATKWVRWGTMKPTDDPEITYEVKKGDAIEGTVIRLWKDKEENQKVTLRIGKGEEVIAVNMSLPSRLQTALGLNPSWSKKHEAKEGTKVRIVYQGQDMDAKGNPHMFDVFFAG